LRILRAGSSRLNGDREGPEAFAAVDLFSQLNIAAAIIPTRTRTIPLISIGSRLLPANGFAGSCASLVSLITVATGERFI
jgi:hypothetical protein